MMRTQIVDVVVVGGRDVVVVVLGGGGDVVVVLGGGGDVVVVVVFGGDGDVVVVVRTGGRDVVVADEWPEARPVVAVAAPVEVVAPPACEAVTVPGTPNAAPDEVVEPAVVPFCPFCPFFSFFASFASFPDDDVFFEAEPETAPGVPAEPDGEAAEAEDDVMSRTTWGGSLGRLPPGATMTRTASRTATPARPASMPRRWDPSGWASSVPSLCTAAPGRGSSNSSRIKKSASGSGVSSAPGSAPLSSMSHPFLVRRLGRRFPQRRTESRAKAYGGA
jgi:hypothetical protein